MSDQIIVVMRHGQRADTAGEIWPDMTTRPWDSPLSEKGWVEIDAAAQEIMTVIPKPCMIFTSPYTRCLQSASIILKRFQLSYAYMTIDNGLSESYDLFNAVRYVSSPDILFGGRYRNMGCWFYSCRRSCGISSRPEIWFLYPCKTIKDLLSQYIFDRWADTISVIKQIGSFPEFEGYKSTGRVKRYDRYKLALKRCTPRQLSRQVPKSRKQSPLPHVSVLLTHLAGVVDIYKAMFGINIEAVKTAGYFIARKRNAGVYELVFSNL